MGFVIGLAYAVRVPAFAEKKPSYSYKGSLLGQTRWQCAVKCKHENEFAAGYTIINTCVKKCAANPPRAVGKLASQGQKICKKGIFTDEDRDVIEKKTCGAISLNRDIVEFVVNDLNGSHDNCPLSAALKGKKCVCPKGTKLDKDHAECEQPKIKKETRENMNLINELLAQPEKNQTSQPKASQKTPQQKVSQPDISESLATKPVSPTEKKLEGATVQFSFDAGNNETKYMACGSYAPCQGDYSCVEHHYTLKRVCGKRPEGKSCVSDSAEAAKDSRLIMCSAGDECVYGTCVRLAPYASTQRSVGAWKCDKSGGYGDAHCQKEFGSGYYCREFGSQGKLCARAQAPYSGLCLQYGCPDKNDSCIIAPNNVPECIRSAP